MGASGGMHCARARRVTAHDYDSLIFDMDGTLWDVTHFCAAAWNIALRKLGLANRTISSADIRMVAGLPFVDCVARLLGDVEQVDAERLVAAIDAEERFALERATCRLYAGVAQGLGVLTARYPLFLVSNCQAWYLQLFWKHTGTQPHFRDHACHGDRGQPKAAMIADMIGRHSLERPIYVGDTAGDQRASTQAGADFAHAAYGFGQAENPAVSFASFTELVARFDGGRAG